MADIQEAQRDAIKHGEKIPEEYKIQILKFLNENYKLLAKDPDVNDYMHSLKFIRSVLQLGGIEANDISKSILLECLQYLHCTILVMEKLEFAELMESEEISKAIKGIAPLIQQLILDIYVVSDLPEVKKDENTHTQKKKKKKKKKKERKKERNKINDLNLNQKI